MRALLEEELTSGKRELPMLHDTALQVRSLCENEECDAQELAALIERDPSLAGHVLSVANSVMYGGAEPTTNLQLAVVRVGTTNLADMALALSLRGRVFDVPGFEDRVRELWRMATASSVYAKEIGRKLGLDQDDAFLAGLLHDVGKPQVLQILVDVVRERSGKDVPRRLAEVAMEDMHAWAGALLCRHWGLPEHMATVVAHHHDPEHAGEHVELARAALLADRLASWALDPRGEAVEFDRESQLLDDLGLASAEIEQLVGLRPRVLTAAESFS
jgi:putative nucleotidyltransferase with HDIG domain